MSQHAPSREPARQRSSASSTTTTTEHADSETARPTLRAFLLGGFTLEQADGESIDVPTSIGRSQSILLLKLLLCHPQRKMARDVLTEIIWPGQSYSIMDGSLSVAKSLLKTRLQALCGQSLMPRANGDPPSYRLAGQSILWTDVDACEHAIRRAVATPQAREAVVQWEAAYAWLQRGVLLADDQAAYWYQARLVQDRRKKLAKQRSQCVLRIADLALECGDSTRAITVLTNEHEVNSIHEDIALHLMELLAQLGRTAEALQCYVRLEAALLECDTEPRTEIQVLAHRLRSERTTRASVNRHLLFQQNEMDEIVTEAMDNLPTQDIADDLRTEQITQERHIVVRDSPFGNAPHEYHEMSLLQATSPFQFASPRIWHVPYQRNPFFTGREDVLARLHEMLNKEKAVVALAQHALCGLGGIGKTQTVLEYIYRYESEYQAVFWIKADTRENLLADFLSLAQLLALPERDAQDQTVATAAMQRWLQEHIGWLLVFDNADDLEMVREVLPTGCQGHILLTTRAQAMGGVAHRLEVEEMSLETGALFLLRRAGLIEPDAPLEKASEKDRSLAEGLVQELGGLPLALDQAGAYIEETASSLQEYLALYHTHRLALLQRRGGLTTDHPESVATTWTLAFTHIESSDPVAADLLRLCAFLDPDAIPEELLLAGLQQLAGSSSEMHQLRFNEAIGSLLRFSLVRRNGDTHTITVHRLIQSVVRDNVLPEKRSAWIQRVIHLLSEAFPPAIEVTIWPTCEKFLPHALLCAHWIELAHIPSLEAASLLNTIGYYLNMRARYEIALPLFQRALCIREEVLGEQHSDTAQTLSNLAYVYHHQDKFEEAMHFLQRSLLIRQHVLGMEHPDTATSFNALALLYRDQGRYEEAEPFFQRALAIRRQIFGIEHPQTAHSLSNLAWLYRNLGKYHEAELLYEQSLTIRKRILGDNHPDTATSLNGLALLYAAHKNYAKAEPLFQQVVTIRKHVLGTKHLHTTQSMNALALLYRDQGEYEKAELLFLEVLAIREHLFGREHPRTLVILHNLTRCQNSMKQ